MQRLLKHFLLRKNSLFWVDSRGRRYPELGELIGKERILRKLRDEFPKLRAGHFCLFLAQDRHRQQDLRKRPQVVAALGGDFKLLDPRSFLQFILSAETF